MDRNMTSQRCSIGFRSGERVVSQWYQFVHSPEISCKVLSDEVGHCHTSGGTQGPLHQHRVRQLVQGCCCLASLGCVCLFRPSPDPFISLTCAQREPTLICEKHRTPADLPNLVVYAKCQLGSISIVTVPLAVCKTSEEKKCQCPAPSKPFLFWWLFHCCPSSSPVVNFTNTKAAEAYWQTTPSAAKLTRSMTTSLTDLIAIVIKNC